MEIITQFLHEKSLWELLAVFLGIAYIVLAIRENNWCWPAAFISTAIYTALFWHVSLLMDAMLNVYYMAMAVYGWWAWTIRKPRAEHKAVQARAICMWPWHYHVYAVLAVVILSALSGTLLERYTQAAWPYLDSFTTWASVLTTFMVAKKVLENWIYWMVINSLSIFLYIDRGLYPTVLLLSIYLGMSVFGFIVWQKRFRENRPQIQMGGEELA